MHLQATGKVHTLWTGFAHLYERHGDLEDARVIFDKATQVRACEEAVLSFLYCVLVSSCAPMAPLSMSTEYMPSAAYPIFVCM